MGFKIKGDGVKSKPSLHCDHCTLEVTDWNDCNVEYEDFPDKEQSSFIQILHKECSQKIVGKTFWMPLRDYITWLIANNGWAIEKNGKLTIKIHEPLGF